MVFYGHSGRYVLVASRPTRTGRLFKFRWLVIHMELK